MPGSTTNYAFNLPLVNDPIDADLWGGQLNANWTSIDGLLKTASDNAVAARALIDVGDIKITARSTAPSLWLLCQGQAVSRTTYASLFSAIGTTYGVGDGSTTFNLPDLGGRVVAGRESTASRLTSGVSGVDGATLGASGGDQNMHQHTHIQDPHSHTLTNGTSVMRNFSGSSNFNSGGAFMNAFNITVDNATAVNQNAGTGNSQNVQPTIVLNYVIYAGV